MIAPETMHARRAALLIHGLTPAARKQVMRKLSHSEAALLQPLLEELSQLGIAPSLGKQLASSIPQSTQTSGKTALERLASLPADQIAIGLKRCEPATMARLLTSHTWPWQQAVLERTSELRRAEVSRHLRESTVPLAPAALLVLCERVLRELPSEPERGQQWIR